MTGKLTFQIVADDRHAIKHLYADLAPKPASIVIEGESPEEIIANVVKEVGKIARECYMNKEKYQDVVFSTK